MSSSFPYKSTGRTTAEQFDNVTMRDDGIMLFFRGGECHVYMDQFSVRSPCRIMQATGDNHMWGQTCR